MEMGYRIEYREGSVVWKLDTVRWGRVVLYSGVCFLFFVLFTVNYWPEGAELLRSWIYPGNVAQTRSALLHMASNLHGGASLSDAVFVFCQEILNRAGCPG